MAMTVKKDCSGAVEKRVDARGLPCPRPVILTRDAIRAGGAESIRVTVDGDVPAENVRRMAESQGWDAEVEREGKDIHIVLTRGQRAADSGPATGSGPCNGQAAAPRVVVFVTSDLFGVGEEELGRILMRAFVKTIKELDPRPEQVIFANSGVRLTTEGSDLIDDLAALEGSGVEIVSCGTCLDYYRLAGSLRVGRASNMYEIASSLVGADRVVKL